MPRRRNKQCNFQHTTNIRREVSSAQSNDEKYLLFLIPPCIATIDRELLLLYARLCLMNSKLRLANSVARRESGL